MEEAVVG